MKCIKPHELEHIMMKFAEAEAAGPDRAKAQEKLEDEIERDFVQIACTAVEDKLQDKIYLN